MGGLSRDFGGFEIIGGVFNNENMKIAPSADDLLLGGAVKEYGFMNQNSSVDHDGTDQNHVLSLCIHADPMDARSRILGDRIGE